jgi:hypothetical protein
VLFNIRTTSSSVLSETCLQSTSPRIYSQRSQQPFYCWTVEILEAYFTPYIIVSQIRVGVVVISICRLIDMHWRWPVNQILDFTCCDNEPATLGTYDTWEKPYFHLISRNIQHGTPSCSRWRLTNSPHQSFGMSFIISTSIKKHFLSSHYKVRNFTSSQKTPMHGSAASMRPC